MSCSTNTTSSGGIRRLSSFPSGTLEHIASFLAAPSRLIFAVAITDRNKTPYQRIMARSSRPDESHSLIVGKRWSTLDFGEVEKELAAKLSDNDIKEILLSINAADKLKRLRLTNCTNITGAGLEPLRGTSTIEQIDLSLAGRHQSPNIDPDPPLSCERVLPILDSIIQRGRDQIKYLQFPHAWRRNRCTGSEFHAFILRYKELTIRRGYICFTCNDNFFYDGVYDVDNLSFGTEYATEVSTCYECMRNYCWGCSSDEDGDSTFLGNCGACKKCFCGECAPMGYCACCEKYYCSGCKAITRFCVECGSGCDDCKLTCENCDRTSCKTCRVFGEERYIGYECDCCSRTLCVYCVPVRECMQLGCNKIMCADCAEAGGEDGIHSCYECGDALCNTHRLFECQQGLNDDCAACVSCLATSFKGNARLYEKVKYLKRHAGLEVDEGYCPCEWCSSIPQLRFKVGQRVLCRICSDPYMGWAYGRVIRLWYQEPSWIEENVFAPYQIELDDGEKIYAPSDTNQVIIKAAD